MSAANSRNGVMYVQYTAISITGQCKHYGLYRIRVQSMLWSVCSVFIVPTGTLRLPWLRFFRAFTSVVRQMPGYNSQRWGTARTLPDYLIVLVYVLFVSTVLFYVLFVCECVLYYCHRVSTQLQLTQIFLFIIQTLWQNARNVMTSFWKE